MRLVFLSLGLRTPGLLRLRRELSTSACGSCGRPASAPRLRTRFSTFAWSCATHLQRTNYKEGDWVADLDSELYRGLEELVGQGHTDTQRLLAALSAKDGGLAFGGLPRR